MTIEQMVRDILEAQGIKGAQSMTAGDLVGGANVLQEIIAKIVKEEKRK